jgi:hypothetical protein
MGIDVGASADGDETVVAVARGGYVYELVTWREADTMRSVGRIIDLLRSCQSTSEIPHLRGLDWTDPRRLDNWSRGV